MKENENKKLGTSTINELSTNFFVKLKKPEIQLARALFRLLTKMTVV